MLWGAAVGTAVLVVLLVLLLVVEEEGEEEEGSAGSASDLQIEKQCGVFYIYPGQGTDGTPAYEFAHPANTGHQSCPFDGIWFCGGMGLAKGEKGYGKGAKGEKEVAKGMKEVAKRLSEGKGAVARSLADLQELGLVRSVEAVKERYERNPKQKQLRDEALAKRQDWKKMSGQVRKRDYKRRKVWRQGEGPEGTKGQSGGDWQWQGGSGEAGEWGEEGLWQDPKDNAGKGVADESSAKTHVGAPASHVVTAGEKKGKGTCRHFLSDNGCHRGEKCRFSHAAAGAV
jgi:hypothetical protein